MDTAACIFENNEMYTPEDAELIVQKMMEYLNIISDQGPLYDCRAYSDDEGNLWVEFPQYPLPPRITFTATLASGGQVKYG